MVETLVLKAAKRNSNGKRASRKLRAEGMVPAIIYGHKLDPVSIALDYHDLVLEIQHHHRLLEVELEGQRDKYLLKEVQHDYLGDKVVHVDLARVDINERVTVEVSLELRGVPAGVTQSGGVLEQINSEIEVECLVTQIPENIRVSVAHLQVGETLLAGQIALPEGVTLKSAPDFLIAAVKVMAEEPEKPAVAPEGGVTEPEVIIREKKVDEAEEAEGK